MISYTQALSYTNELHTPQDAGDGVIILREGFLPVKSGGTRIFIVDKTGSISYNGDKVGTTLVWTIR